MKKNLAILFCPKTEPENMMKNTPLSLLKVGSELAGAGYEVAIIDERFEEDYQERLRGLLAKAVFFGISVMTGYQIQGAIRASSFVKNNSDLPVIWGGWHPSILPEETLRNRHIDVVVKGQGEATMRDLANAIKNGADLKYVEGVSYKKGADIIANRCRDFQDVNSFQPIRLDMLDMGRYISANSLGKRAIFWSSSQGCPYKCAFCCTQNVYKRRWSGLRADKLLKQVEALVDRYNIDAVTFAEDNFFVDIKRAEDFCLGLIRNKLKISWVTDIRIDQANGLSDDFMRLLKESGCSKLYIGAESGDQEVLDLVDKGIKLDDIYSAAAKLDRHHIVTDFFLMVGFPNNPERDLKKTIELIRDIKSRHPDHQFTPFIYTPYPGTPLIELAVKKGFKVPDRLEGWVNWSVFSISTPWVNKAYLDRVSMYSKCFYPLAFPSESLKAKFRKRFMGPVYRILHKLAEFRVRNNFYHFPIEWILIKIFYRIKIKYNVFDKVQNFR